MKRLATLTLSCLLSLAGACSSDTDGFALATSQRASFQSDAYPVLLRDCAFPTCHGSPERQFRMWGPGRVRLDPLAPLFDNNTDPVSGLPKQQEANEAEVRASYDSALGFVDAKDPTRSLILRKPLSAAAGGTGHLGVDRFGRNVYRSTDSEGYTKLSRWVFSMDTQ